MNRWLQLRRFTPARVGLGAAGISLPTAALLEFQADQALARDAVHTCLNVEALEHEIRSLGRECAVVQSAARNRTEYLMRPDLGRKLSEESAALLSRFKQAELVFVVADGLSANAVQNHAPPLLRAVFSRLAHWRISPVFIGEQGRVALGDEIGERLGAELVVVVIGERPGLSSPDSLGIYITYRPRVGCSDAERNCISNVRPAGLSFEAAAHRLAQLLEAARDRRVTGVGLKDESVDLPDSVQLPGASQPAR